MSRVQLETRRHSRAAALWALVGGVGLGISAVMFLAGASPTLTTRLSLAAAHVLAFGLVGDLWLATLLRYLSAQPSRSAVHPRLLAFIFGVWNASLLVSAVTFTVHGSVKGRSVLPIPFAGALAALAIALLVLPVVVGRQSGLPATAFHHLAGAAALLVGLLLADVAYLTDNLQAELAALFLVVGGWLPLAAASLFYATFDYEAYEDRRVPLASAIAISVAALARFAYAYRVLGREGLQLFTQIAGFVVLFVFALALRSRWRGGMTYWYERIALAATVALAVAVFLGLEGIVGSPVGPLAVPGGPVLVAASFYGCIVPLAAAFAVMLDQRDLAARTARLVLWPTVVGGLVAATVARLSSRLTGSVATAIVGLGALGVAIGATTLGLHLLRRPRLRAVR